MVKKVKIRELPEHVANLIAAGEVVERPCAVVRELVDNALDAAARSIEITIVEGGQQRIAVADDGCGMSEEDAPLAFGRHCTSKISAATDLESIGTRGFRGEALPSIASVARVTLRTRDESACGTEIRIEGGTLLSKTQTACPRGTQIVVENLFFNTPVRRKFLKTPRGETARIKKLIQHVALASPQVRFRLHADGKEILHLIPRQTFQERCRDLWSDLAVEATLHGPISVRAQLSHPGVPQATPEGLVVLVNGRVVTDRMVVRAVRDGFGGMLREREYPFGVVAVELDPSAVDVNVHPQKSEVRFRNSSHVFAAVRTAVQEGVRGLGAPVREIASAVRPDVVEVSEVRTLSNAAPRMLELHSTSHPHREAPARPSSPRSMARFIGQVLECYLIFDAGDHIEVMDMHAAHERINYNKIIHGMRDRSAAVQQLLVPIVVQLTEEETEALVPIVGELECCGFSVEAFGEKAAVVRAVPAMISSGSVPSVVRNIVRGAIEDRGTAGVSDWQHRLAARIACHASIRAGQKLAPEEAYALLDAYYEAETGAACPHGRPVMKVFSSSEVERWFGRDR